MTLHEFIKANRGEISDTINQRLRRTERTVHTQEECRLWVLNDEELYLWARGAGVRI